MRRAAALVAVALAAPAAAEETGEAPLDPMLERAARIVITDCHPDAASLSYDPGKDKLVAGGVFTQRIDARCPDSETTMMILCFSQASGPRRPECMVR